MKLLKKAKLRKMYEEMTIAELMEELEIKSPSSLYILLDKAGIERKTGQDGERTQRVKINIKLVD